MFGLAAGLYQTYMAPPKISILMIGLDGAGKTTLLERCKVTEFEMNGRRADAMAEQEEQQRRRRREVSGISVSLSQSSVRGSSSILLPHSLPAGGSWAGGRAAPRSSVVIPLPIRPDDNDDDGDDEDDEDDNEDAVQVGASVAGSTAVHQPQTSAEFSGPVPPLTESRDVSALSEAAPSGTTTAVVQPSASQRPPEMAETAAFQQVEESTAIAVPVGCEGVIAAAGAATVPSESSSSSARGAALANTSTGQRRRLRFGCPAPKAYAVEHQVALEKEEEYTLPATDCAPPTENGSKKSELQSRSLTTGDDSRDASSPLSEEQIAGTVQPSPSSAPALSESQREVAHATEEEEEEEDENDTGDDYAEYDVRRDAKMLPLSKIRPTAGMNLGKLEACGCKCSIWDLSGAKKMRALWDRYYMDADAVVFVVDASPSKRAISMLAEAKAEFLRVRHEESLRGIPMLLFANKLDRRGNGGISAFIDGVESSEGSSGSHSGFGQFAPPESLYELAVLFGVFPKMTYDYGKMGSSEGVDSDELIAVFGGSAKTGEGVRAAFEWLIPLSKRFQRQRKVGSETTR